MKHFKKIILSGLSVLIALTLVSMNPDRVLALNYREYGPYYKETINAISESKVENLTNKSLQESLDLNEGQDLELAEERLQGFYEDVSRRDAYTKVYVSDSSEEEHMYYYMAPVHEYINGKWETIDVSFSAIKRNVNEYTSTTTKRDIVVDEDNILLTSSSGTIRVYEDSPELLVDGVSEVYLDGDHLDIDNKTKVYPSVYGYSLVKKAEDLNRGIHFEISSTQKAILSQDQSAVLILDEEENIESSIELKWVYEDREYVKHVNPEFTLEYVENHNYILKSNLSLETYAGFDVDVYVRKTLNYGDGDVLLWGVRNGANFQNNSYNPGTGFEAGVSDRTIIGNARYNNGAVFGCEIMDEDCLSSVNNKGIVEFKSGTSIKSLIGQNRVVESATLNLSYNTDSSAASPNGVKYRLSVLDTNKYFSNNNPYNVTYNNYQTYLNNSANGTVILNTETVSGTGWREVNWDITEAFNIWENSGNHHAIEIWGVSDGNGNYLDSSHVFYNHDTSNISYGVVPKIKLVTIKDEPISDNLPLNSSELFMRAFTTNIRKDNVIRFGALGFDSAIRPLSTIEVKVENKSGDVVYNESAKALSGYRTFSQYTSELGYNLIDNAQVYYKLTSNAQLANLLYNANNKLSANHLYTVKYKVSTGSEDTGWKNGDTFLIYNLTGYERVPRLLSFYGVSDTKQFLVDNNMMDDLLVQKNQVIIRNPTKNQDKVYQPTTLSENDKRMIDANLIGRNQHCQYGYEPINLNTGNFLYDNNDTGYIEFDTSYEIKRSYNSLSLGKDSVFGRNWSFSLQESLYFSETGSIMYEDSTGRMVTFEKSSDGTYTTPYGTSYSITKEKDYTKEYTVDNGYYDKEDTPRTTKISVDYYKYILSSAQGNEVKEFNHYGNITKHTLSNGMSNVYSYNDKNLLQSFKTAGGKEFSFTFNGEGYISKIITPNGTQLLYGYDTAGNLIEFVDQEGFSIHYSYDDAFRMVSYTSRETGELVIENTYNAQGQIETQKDALGNVSSFTYGSDYTEITDYEGNIERIYVDAYGHTQKIEKSDGNNTENAYDSKGNLIQETLENGVVFTHTYDDHNRLMSTTNEYGKVKSYEYDDKGNIIQQVDFDGSIIKYTYSSAQELLKTTFEDGTYTENMYENGLLIRERDIYGDTKTHSYSNGQKVSTTYSDGTSTSFVYDDLGFLREETNRLGVVTSYTYDNRGQLISESVGGNTTSYIYNGDGEKVSETDPNGNVTVYEYDGWSRISKVTTLDGSKEYLYDANGNKIQETNELGQTTTYTYDLNNRLLTTTNPVGEVSSNVYDTLGRLTETTSFEGIVTLKEYDDLGHVISETTQDRTMLYVYNDKGQLVSTTNYLGQVSTQEYDALGNVLKQVDFLGNETLNTYDLGRLIETKVNGKVTKYVYDTSGNIIEEKTSLEDTISSTQYLGGVANTYTLGEEVTTYYTYNKQGYLESVKDALGNTTTYLYDGNGNEVSITDARGNVSTKVYDHANRVVQETSAQGYMKTYTYDALGREIESTTYDVVNNGAYTTQKVYNEKGQLVETIDPLGRSTKNKYDEKGQLIEVDTYGRTTKYTYDGYGNKTSEETPLKTTTYTYNERDLLIQEVDTLGYEKTYTYDEKNQLIVEEDNRYGYTQYTYDDLGQVIESKDLRGNTQTFTYNEVGQKVSETDTLGNTTYFTYSASGQLVEEKSSIENVRNTFSETGRISSYTTQENNPVMLSYDEVGNVIAVENALGHIVTFAYDKDNQKTGETDARGNTTEYVYDARGNVIETRFADGSSTQSKYDAGNRKIMDVDALGFETIYEYNEYDELVKTTDALGNETVSTYDVLGQEITKTNALGYTTEKIYDEKHRLVEEKDALGHTTKYTYNDKNEIVETIYPSGLKKTNTYNEFGDLVEVKSSGKEAPDEAYEYNALGQKISAVDIQGVKEYYTYDSLGNLNTTSTDDLTLEMIEYDAFGRKVKSIDTYGLESSYTLDALGNTIQESRSNGYVLDIVYDAEGNVIKESDGRGDTLYEYDTLNRLIKTTYPDLTTEETIYDLLGNVLETKNRQNQIETYIYDELGREISKVDVSGYETKTEYDALGNAIKTQDAYGTILEFKFDGNNNLIETKHGDTIVLRKEYDAMGQLLESTDSEFNRDLYQYDIYGNLVSKEEMNTKTSFVYDDRNNITQVKTSDSLDTFVYDEKSNLIESHGEAGSSQYVYDIYNNLTKHTDPHGYSVGYTYTKDGDIASINYPGGKRVEYIYDMYGRVTEIKEGTSSILYTYTAMDSIESIDTPILKTTYTYSDTGLITRQLTENKKSGKPSVDLEYTYNEAGYIQEEKDNLSKHTTTYEYDAWGQITKEIKDNIETAYTYDKKGNRIASIREGIKTHYSYSASSQLLKVSNPKGMDISYTYDNKGNATTKRYENGYEEIYSYDGSSQLKKIENSDGRVIEYGYDSLRNRISKEDTYDYRSIVVGNSPSSNGLDPQTAIKGAKEAYLASLIEERACTMTSEQDNTTTRTTHFVNNINTEYEVVLETYQNGNLNSENVFDSGLVSQTLQKEKTYTARNLRGDILLKSDVSGSEENYSYDLFGKPTSATTLDLGYNGEVHEGSLQYLRARYYDTETGVFITRDTYSGEDKDIQSQNRYTYVGNNPANYNDPSGHFFSSIWNGITNAWNGLKQGVKKVANAVGGFISNTWNNLTGNNKSTGSFKQTGTPVKRPSLTSPGSSNSKATGIVKGAAALAGAAQSILKVEKEYKTIQQQLSDKEAQWKSQGLSASQIDAKRIEFVKKYCEDLGFTTVETEMMLKKLGLAENQANASGNKKNEKEAYFQIDWLDVATNTLVFLVSSLVETLLDMLLDGLSHALAGLLYVKNIFFMDYNTALQTINNTIVTDTFTSSIKSFISETIINNVGKFATIAIGVIDLYNLIASGENPIDAIIKAVAHGAIGLLVQPLGIGIAPIIIGFVPLLAPISLAVPPILNGIFSSLLSLAFDIVYDNSKQTLKSILSPNFGVDLLNNW